MDKQFTAVFPREKTPHDYEHIEALCGPDAYSTGHMDGWNDCRRAMLEAQEKAAQPPAASVTDADALAQEIRRVDGEHKMGAGQLAECIVQWLAAQENSNG